MITLYIKGQELKVNQCTIAADTIDYITVKANFMTSDWNGLSKVVHFKQGENDYAIVLDSDNEIKENRHLNLASGTYEVWVHGNDDNKRITTTISSVTVQKTGGQEGDPPIDVPLSVGEQILQKAENAENTANEVKNLADSGAFDGEDGADGKDGTDGQDGNGIDRIEKISTDGLVDTYRIYFTDGTTYDYTVTNGKDGSSAGGTSNYEELENLPSINGNVLVGNKTTEELGIFEDKKQFVELSKFVNSTYPSINTVEDKSVYAGAYSNLYKIDITVESEPKLSISKALNNKLSCTGLAVKGNYLYACYRDGTAATDRNESVPAGMLYICDIDTLEIVKTLELDWKATRIIIHDNIMIVNLQLKGWDLYDITNQTSPVLKYSYRVPEGDFDEYQGGYVFEQNNEVYYVTASFGLGLHFYKITNTETPEKIGDFLFSWYEKLNGIVHTYDVIVEYPYVYATIATTDPINYGTEKDYRGIYKIDIRDFSLLKEETADSIPFQIAKVNSTDLSTEKIGGDTMPSKMAKYKNIIITNSNRNGLFVFDLGTFSYQGFVEFEDKGIPFTITAADDDIIVASDISVEKNINILKAVNLNVKVNQINNDLLTKADQNDIPTQISSFENDSNYQSEEQVNNTVSPIASGLENYLEVADILGIWKNATAGRTNFSNLFENSNVKTIPLIDTSSGTIFNYMFRNCAKLESIPFLDMSKAINMFNMFYDCISLTSFKGYDTSKVTNFSGTFMNCSAIEDIEIDTSSATAVSYLFSGCSALTSLKTLDFSNVTQQDNVFRNCAKLVHIEFVPESIKLSISLSACSLLDSDSVASIFEGLADLTDTEAQTLTLHKDVQITQAQADGAVAKNWNIVGGTVNG